ncbi:MAG: membrane dipeptidase [Bacteroidaceae bacterium]|nr:membrane dipeptidase [Bacteroidaceae bacterium]
MAFDWKGEYAKVTSTFPNHGQRPVIGITGNFGDRGCELAEGYFRSVLEAGGVPMVIPPYEDREALLGTLDHIDGLLLSGGGDINPLYLGEEPSPALHSINPRRDLPELLLTRLAYDRQLPMLGICRGCQVLAAALGGTVYQDIHEAMPDTRLLKHSQDLPREYASHTIDLAEGSLIRGIMQANTLPVNSFHHQAVGQPGPHLRVSATAPDGVVEAIESTEYKSILGVQWHPECFILRNDTTMLPPFEWLVGEARSFHEAVSLHRHILTLDSHCDTPMFADKGINFTSRDPQILVDLHKMTEGHLDASIMVAYLPQGERNTETYRAVTEKTQHLLHYIQQLADSNPSHIGLARTPDDLYHLKSEGKKALMMGIENGYAIGRDLSLIENFRRQGVVYMTLCHNGDNDICDSARGNAEHGGLSTFGREVVREMNRVGMMVDLSHAAESSFWQALEVSETPIVCSHSSCRSLCDHPRNLTDEQMRALAEKDGVMQVTLYEGFLRRDGQATIKDAVQHINHAVEVMGIEHVGIGTDFDGDGGVPGVASASEIINLTRLLREVGYTDEQLRLLWGENFLRVMRIVQLKVEVKS